MSKESEDEVVSQLISVENPDGSTTKVMKFGVAGPIQVTASDDDEHATVSIPLRLQIFSPVTLNQGLSLNIHRDQIRKMAEIVGLIWERSPTTRNEEEQELEKDSRSIALDNIQDIILSLLTREGLPDSAREDLRIAEALARHRDLVDFLDSRAAKRLAEIKRANDTADYDEEERQ